MAEETSNHHAPEPLHGPEDQGDPSTGGYFLLNRRLGVLLELTGELARLHDEAELADLLLEAVPRLGANAGALCRLAEGGTTLEILAQLGSPAEATNEPLVSEVIRTGEPIFRSSPDDPAVAIVPLIADERPYGGALILNFAEPQAFEHADRVLLTMLAAQCATALERTRLYKAHREAREEAERAQEDAERQREHLAFLATSTAALAASLDYHQTLEQVADLAVSRLADSCTVHFLTDEGQFEVVTRSRPLGGKEAAVDSVLRRLPFTFDDLAGPGAVSRTGRSELYTELPDEVLVAVARTPEERATIRSVEPSSAMVLPLVARRRRLGALTLLNFHGRMIAPDDLALAEELAARAAVAIDNAHLFSERTIVARGLQASLLPPALPVIPNLDLGARYLAGAQVQEVGGDFYDAFPTGPRRWVLVVGDVCGRGVDAAMVASLARHTVRSAAIVERNPSPILAHLNEVLLREEGGREPQGGGPAIDPTFCTALVVVVEERKRGIRLRLAAAGHPLPILRRADGKTMFVGKPGALLGVFPSVRLHEEVVTLRPGDVLCCYTDGLTECRSNGQFFGEEGLVAALTDARGSAGAIARSIEAAACSYVGGDPGDDLAVLVVSALEPTST